MERDSVGQTFLSALVDVHRQECPRHSGAAPAMADSLGGLGVLAVYHLRAARPTFRLLYRELVPVRRAGRFGTGWGQGTGGGGQWQCRQCREVGVVERIERIEQSERIESFESIDSIDYFDKGDKARDKV
jgi:hypothetical protein